MRVLFKHYDQLVTQFAEDFFFQVELIAFSSRSLGYRSKMRAGIFAGLLAGLGWIGGVASHNILLKAHSRECFHEELHREDKMTVTFQVGDRENGGSGNLDIDFYVNDGQSRWIFGLLTCSADH